jgi:hypothetical protein
MKMLQSYLSEAKQEYSNGLSESVELNGVAKFLRSFTRAQVRARQVINTVNPPPASPEEL